jgi:translation elongation factor EF-Tu-like GTPase
MLTGAAQMEGAILVVAVMMVLKFKQGNMLFYLKR